MSNAKTPAMAVYWSRLLPVGSDPVYRRECPFCEEGIFLVGRDQGTFILEEFDRCVSCAQAVRYIDIEKMRNRERSRESLRLQIARGTEEEVWAAIEELMRREAS